jgi:hypothetical protein
MAEWSYGTADRLDPAGMSCHVVVFGERHLRHVLLSYMHYYNSASQHPSVYVIEGKSVC